MGVCKSVGVSRPNYETMQMGIFFFTLFILVCFHVIIQMTAASLCINWFVVMENACDKLESESRGTSVVPFREQRTLQFLLCND